MTTVSDSSDNTIHLEPTKIQSVKICLECGKEFINKGHESQIAFTKRKFCSKQCSYFASSSRSRDYLRMLAHQRKHSFSIELDKQKIDVLNSEIENYINHKREHERETYTELFKYQIKFKDKNNLQLNDYAMGLLLAVASHALENEAFTNLFDELQDVYVQHGGIKI